MNHLEKEKSPYLIQHRENPVDWYPWGAAAFQKAKEENKPVFLSVGYSTCHWCHVMAHESFEDEEVATILNRDFISIKVDREERPDVDAVYMNVCQLLTGSGGWPLTVFLTPEQKPFFAGTYFPKKSRYGRPGLIELLKHVAILWKKDSEALVRDGERIADAAAGNEEFLPGTPDASLLDQGFAFFLNQYDQKWGGFGAAPKFPTPHNLLFLLQYSLFRQEESSKNMVENTLDAMERGGICDQIGGGFSRYSTDDSWLVPHFEKMLYDNALLALAYLEAYQMTGKERYADVVQRTLDYLLRDLAETEGGFASGQDADSDGVEGKYYVFTPDEICELFGKEKGKAFCRRYDITREGNFEGKSIPNRILRGEAPLADDSPELQRLREYRRKRTRLHKDDKVLLSWNGWAIAAFARAGKVLGELRYQDAARQCQDFIAKNMTNENGRLSLRWREGEAAYDGQLDDYAVYVFALLELYDATLEASYLAQAVFYACQMKEWFEDSEHGGYFQTAFDSEKLIARPKETYDGALPSGNSVAGLVWLRLAHYTGEVEHQEAADRQLHFLAGSCKRSSAGHSFALLALQQALSPFRELICCSASDLPKDFLEYLAAHSFPNLTVIRKTPENADLLAEIAPFTREYPIPNEGTAYYLCCDGTCQAPETDWQKLLKKCENIGVDG
ncbi:thioredoxin domain-containing protein [Hominifimenecus sp. rT4P-3]|uniref:thioredoxin domain-containing protein n=1 Tax=Hominifimenecus sp. rT4P-3 TaxID=3242979 RepID=UPI003DA531BD